MLINRQDIFSLKALCQCNITLLSITNDNQCVQDLFTVCMTCNVSRVFYSRVHLSMSKKLSDNCWLWDLFIAVFDLPIEMVSHDLMI